MLAAAAAGQPDVVLMDLKMPGIDGMEVLRRVKKAYPDVQVIMLTGHGSVQAGITAREKGAFTYMIKPVDLSDLLIKIAEAVIK